jgi:hypothetical protein
MKFSITGKEKSDCLIEVSTWAGLTVHVHVYIPMNNFRHAFYRE